MKENRYADIIVQSLKQIWSYKYNHDIDVRWEFKDGLYRFSWGYKTLNFDTSVDFCNKELAETGIIQDKLQEALESKLIDYAFRHLKNPTQTEKQEILNTLSTVV
jgi:hypothetical protein